MSDVPIPWTDLTEKWAVKMKVWNWNFVAVACYCVFVWIALPSAVVCQDYTQKACPGGKDDSPPVEITLSCPTDENLVVSLVEAVFGRNQYGGCTYTDGDCKDNLGTAIFEKECAGKPKCTVTFDRPLSPTCSFATFISVSYNCLIPVATTPLVLTEPSTSTVSTATATKPIVKVTAEVRNKATTDAAKKTEEDSTGLIVGCVFAVIITVVLLIIAIFMVVRRLVCGGDLSDDEEKKSSSCNILPCLGIRSQDDCSTKSGRNQEANSSSSAEPGNSDKSGATAAATSMRKRKKRGRRADKNQNMSPRLAPVGQEDEGNKTVPQTGKNSSLATTAVDYPLAASSFPCGVSSSARSSTIVEPSASAMPPITTTHAVKRHSSGARVMCGVDTSSDQWAAAGGGVGHAEVMRRAGSGRDDISKGGSGGRAASTQMKVGRGMDRVSWPGKDGYYLSGVTKADILNPYMKEDVAHASLPRTQFKTENAMAPSDVARALQLSGGRSYKTASGNFGDKTAGTVTSSGAKKRPLYDAVAVPNTEAFTVC